MRALSTQLCILIGVLTAVELYGRQPNLPVAALLGAAAACTVYIALILGDFAVHRYIEDKTGPRASLTYLNPSFEPAENEAETERRRGEKAYETPDSMAA